MLSIEESVYPRTFVKDRLFPNISLFNFYNVLFSPSKNRQFIRKFMELRKDAEIKLEEKSDEITAEMRPNSVTEYVYRMVHPIPPERKKFLGPSQLNVEDTYKFIVESKSKLYLELSSKCSGYMLVDTFIPHALFIFEQERSDVKVNLKYYVEFVKPNPLKKMVEERGYSENEEDLNKLFIDQIEPFLSWVSSSPHLPQLSESNSASKIQKTAALKGGKIKGSESHHEKSSFKTKEKLKETSGVADSTMETNDTFTSRLDADKIRNNKKNRKKENEERQTDYEVNYWFYGHVW